MLDPQAEKLVKAHQTAEFLVSDLKEAHAKADRRADTMLLQDLLLRAMRRRGRVCSPIRSERNVRGRRGRDNAR